MNVYGHDSFFFENVKLLFKDTWIVRLVSPAMKRNPIIHSPPFSTLFKHTNKLKMKFLKFLKF